MTIDKFVSDTVPQPETDNQAFAGICSGLSSQPVIGLDTEFERSKTYSARFALLQLSGGGETWLIDAPCISDWDPFGALLADPALTKIMHGCEEDLEVMAEATGVYPASLFDTQIGAAFAGLEYGMGYMRLVAELLEFDLPKESQRSDWLKRPLSEQQLRYAALDAACLPELYAKLLALIEERGMTDWCLEECAALVARKQARDTAGYDFRRVKAAGTLESQELSVLRALVDWRERQARDRDLPRSWVVDDPTLIGLSQQQPDSQRALAAVSGMRPNLVRARGEMLLQVISEGRDQPASEWPRPAPATPSPEQRKWLKALKAEVRQKAEQLDLPPALLAGQRVLNALLNSGYPDGPWTLPESLHGWRREVIGEALLAALDTLCKSRGSSS